MSNIPKVIIKVDADNNSLIDFLKADNENPMFRMINETNQFKLKKFNTSNNLSEDVMTVNEDGVIIFPKNVEFKGTSTIINSDIVTYQDQQIDLGLSDATFIDVSNGDTTFTKSTSGGNFRYQIRLQDTNKVIPFAVNDYVIIQNLFSNAQTPVPLLNSIVLQVKVVTNSSPRSFTVETPTEINTTTIATNITNAVVSKISSVASNAGVRFLTLNNTANNATLVEASLSLNTDNKLLLENNTGTIEVGSNNVSHGINIGTLGARSIQVGQSTATVVDLDAITVNIDSTSGGMALNSTSGAISIGNNASASAINVGTTQARSIQVGSNAATVVDLDAITVNIDSTTGGMALNSTSGPISIGNNASASAINIGTTLARSIQVGSNAATVVDLDAITVNIDSTTGGMALNSTSGPISIGNNASASAINIGTTLARAIQVGSNAAASVMLDALGTISLDSAAASNFTTSGGLLTLSGAGGVTVTSTGGTLTLNGTGRTVDLDAALLDINSTSISMNSTGMIAINSSANVINIGNNAVNLDINIGTAGTRVVQVGSNSATVNLDAGAGGISLDAVGPSNFTTTNGLLTVSGGSGATVAASGGNLTLNGASGVFVNSSGGVINVGNDSVSGTINVGTAGVRTIQVGHNNAAVVNLDALVFSIDSTNASNINTSSGILTVGGAGGVALNSNAGIINIGNEAVTGTINVGTAGVRTIQVGHNNAAVVNLDALVFSIDSTNASNINTSSGILTVGGAGGVGINSSAGVINIGNDSVAQNINIGTAGARTITLGSTSSTSVTAFNFTIASDAILKTNITPLASTLDKILQLDGYTYNWKNSENTEPQIGLIAQEVEKQFPELVTQNDNFKSVNYLGMIAVLIHAMKEQQQEIENIRNKMN